MRLGFLLSITYGFALSLTAMLNDKLDQNVIILVSIFVGGGFTGKTVQKFAEVKRGN